METHLARMIFRRCTVFVHPWKNNIYSSCLHHHSFLRCSSVIVSHFTKPNQHFLCSTTKRALSSDDRKPFPADSGSHHVKQTELFENILQEHKQYSLKRRSKHVTETQEKLKQTKEKIKQTQEKLILTQQRMKESKQRIIQDIRDTRTMMKERMEEIIERENIWTVPNVLCVTRIIFSPYLGYLILQSDFHMALGFLLFAGVTDMLDGWIARTWPSQSSKLGSFLDPMADKVLIATLFISLTYVDLIPVPLTALIIARDLTLVGAGFYIRYRSLPPPKTLSRYFDATHATAQLAPTTISKINTMIQLAMVASTLGAPVLNYVDHPALHALWFVTAGTTVASAVSYLVSNKTYKFLQRKKR